VSSESPCPKLAQLEHIALATDDVEGLRNFYMQLGGVASLPCDDPDTDSHSWVLDFCGVRLELFKREESGKGPGGAGHPSALVHLGFALGSADAVDELTDVLAAAGYRVLELPHRTRELARYESVVLDPDGNRLKLTV
jgi:lactoylglutathione lyase